MKTLLSPTSLRWGLTALMLLAPLSLARAYKKDALNINVQSSVGDHDKSDVPAGKRMQTYFLAPPLEEPSALKLIRPVDPKLMADEANKVLQAKGYRPAVKGETPDMTVTVLYGRTYIHNPYPSPADLGAGGQDWSVREVAKFQNSGAYVMSSGIIEEKRQYAAEEKLAIIVAAWAWDPEAMLKHKAKRL